MIISIIGFMGCGKSSVGRRLSELLCRPFIDLDDAVEEVAGRSVPEIFATDGEGAFRLIEKDVLESILQIQETRQSASLAPSHFVGVLALGGGTVMTPECAEMVREKTTCIYLRASVDTLVSHLEGESSGRPMLHGESHLRQKIENLLSLRSATYENTAHIIIDTDNKSVDTIAREIMQKLH